MHTTKDDISVEDQEKFLDDLGNMLYERLQSLSNTSPRLAHSDVTMGFAKNRETFTPLTVVRGDFEAIGSTGDKAIIVYALAKHTGFGLYDEENSVCLPLDIDEVKMIFMDLELLWEQYRAASLMVEMLDRVIDAN